VLKGQVKRMVDGGLEVSEWLVRGRTVTIPKEGCSGRPDQFRSITYLNTAYKLLTGTLMGWLGEHVQGSHPGGGVAQHQDHLHQHQRWRGGGWQEVLVWLVKSVL